ncbi:MAG: gamma-glutamyltransferase [Methyloligellaceae bacterium]
MGSDKGVVAAGHQLTADAAAEILGDGGNAFDAALAGMMMACVPEVVFASIGGGGFLMAHVAETGGTQLFDFFAQTPRRKRAESELDFYEITADFGPAAQEFHIGAGSTAVPGFAQGLFAVHERLCRLPMARLAAPAAKAARDGVTLTDFHAYLFTIVAPILTASEGARGIFAPEGHLLEGGETYRNPDFAETLEALAEEGPRLFTEGEVARAIAAESQEHGGHLSLEDLGAYRVETREPLIWRHGDATVALNPAPAASGALVAFGLGLLEGLTGDGQAPGPLELAATMAETNRARAKQGNALASLTDPDVIAQHLAQLAAHAPATRGTTHISVIDGEGNAAAATITNGEGNGYMLNRFGFMLNNMLGEEDLNPNGFHGWQPDTRLSTMMAPTIVRAADGSITAMGSGGSNRIRTAILQVIVNLLDHGLTLDAAVDAARLHVEKTGQLSFEDQLAPDARAALLATYPDAHAWPEPNLFFGGVHTARRHADGRLEGAGDPRRCGVAILV